MNELDGGARILSLLVPAVGGQGGGVLSEWIVDAALLDGLAVHGTSIPGVAQRTGSTTYYVELFTERGADEPAFSLYPVPGELDVLVAPEFLEVGRMIELGFVSPARTTVIASTHRLLSIHEKIATGRAIYPQADLQRAAESASRRLLAFDALALAREHGTEPNAILLGALAGAGVVPISQPAFRKAIESKGVAVKSNLAGFDLGLALASRSSAAGSAAAATAAPTGTQTSGFGVPAGAAASTATLPADIRTEVEQMPREIREIAVHGVAKLVDYQDVPYARKYLRDLRPFVAEAGASAAHLETARAVARYLALWMTYEDAVRVADLKTRASRFARIRAGVKDPGAVVVVTDFLKPDLDEIWGVLPDRLVRPFARWAQRRWPHGRPTLGQHVRTTTVSGFLRVWMLARLKRWRPISYRAREEHARIAGWLDAVRACAARDPALAAEVARSAQVVKGYGDVRRRTLALQGQLVAAVLTAADLQARRGDGFAVATALAARLRALMLSGPEAEARIPSVTSATLARLEAGDVAGALASV
ncbi:MAG TPA: indolepyruvate oxidoreductase subunit beta family protein [Methylomirabilota bacterium]|nr:indolepyruvate oxidoreductase subunit beta family protein [Methylomirabilota bacterium]